MDCYEFEYLDEVKPTFFVPPPVGVITQGNPPWTLFRHA